MVTGVILSILFSIGGFAKENDLTVKLEELKKNIAERMEHKKFLHFVFAFRGNRPLKESLREYREHLKEYTDKLVKKAKDRLDKK